MKEQSIKLTGEDADTYNKICTDLDEYKKQVEGHVKFSLKFRIGFACLFVGFGVGFLLASLIRGCLG